LLPLLLHGLQQLVECNAVICIHAAMLEG
jgi:hypothetical protein